MELKWNKLVVAILLGALRLLAGALPIKIHSWLQVWQEQDEGQKTVNEERRQQVERWMSFVQSFGGGVLMATCLLHMVPEVGRSVRDINSYYGIKSSYPLAELLVCSGFFLLYFTEEFAQWSIARLPKVGPEEEEAAANRNEEDAENCNKPESEQAKDVTGHLQKFLDTETKSQQQVLRCAFVILALSLHSIFEGLAVGLQNSVSTIWYLFAAISIHSFTILFCIGLELLLANTRPWVIFGHVLLLSVMSPLGVILGMLITLDSDSDENSVKSNAVVFLEGFSSGTILYITFFEVLAREKTRKKDRIIRSVCLLGGFLFMAALEVIEV